MTVQTRALTGGGGGGAGTISEIVAGAGLTGSGLTGPVATLDVGAHADGSITVNANDIQVGVLATDAQHGTRGGGTLHAVATGAVAGFMSAADKTKLDGIEAGATADQTHQDVYDFTGAVQPKITLSAANGPFTLRDAAAPIGDLLVIEDNAGADYAAISATEMDLGFGARRLFRADFGAATGRGGFECWPDTFTITSALSTAPSQLAMFNWTGTQSTSIAGGGGLGNDSFGGFISLTGTFNFLDAGNLFNSGLLFNFGIDFNLSANIGPLYTLVNQPTVRSATAGAKTMSQHNAVRAQTSIGPNTAGTMTVTSIEYYYAFLTVDGSGGAAAVTAINYFAAKSPNLVGGGTVGTLNVIDIVDITGPTTIRGINSLMNSGTFIRHIGTAAVQLGGQLQLGAGATVDVVLSRGAANRLDLASGDSMRIVSGGLQLVDTGGQIVSTVSGEVQVTSTRWGFGIAPAGANWAFAFSATARTITVAGDFANCLNTTGGSHTINAALSTFTQWTINAPGGTIGTGSVVNAANVIIQTAPSVGTNRYGLLITSNPSGGTLNYALRVTNGDARFDARVDINNPIALGGGAAATLGTIGGSGPTAAAQAQWVEIDIGGTPHWIPVWT